MKNHQYPRAWLVLALAVLGVAIQTGCMTVQRGTAVVQNTNTQQYSGKTIAALPVKTQAGIATDSILPLRQEINKSVGRVAQARLGNATVLDVTAVTTKLNQANLLSVYEQVMATYENTGVMDRRQTEALGRGLGCDFLLFTRLKAEKMDIVISRGFGANVDATLVDVRTGEVTWSGTGEWKRGGVYGFGETKLDEAARRLLDLAFSSLTKTEGAATVNAPAPVTRAPAAPSVAKEIVSAPAPVVTEPSPQKMTMQQVQQRLTALGYQPGTADGMMGKNTVEALRKFQQDNNLAKTGKADNETVAKLLQTGDARAEPSNPKSRATFETPQKPPPAKPSSASDL